MLEYAKSLLYVVMHLRRSYNYEAYVCAAHFAVKLVVTSLLDLPCQAPALSAAVMYMADVILRYRHNRFDTPFGMYALASLLSVTPLYSYSAVLLRYVFTRHLACRWLRADICWGPPSAYALWYWRPLYRRCGYRG